MNSHFLIIILKTYLKKRNERETEKEKEKECKRERNKETKKDRKKKKTKKWEFGLKMADSNSKPTKKTWLPIM
jgi:hypothetical protein